MSTCVSLWPLRNAHHLKAIREANRELMKIATFYNSESLSELFINEIGFSKILFQLRQPLQQTGIFRRCQEMRNDQPPR